jgi:hypothetical protein
MPDDDAKPDQKTADDADTKAREVAVRQAECLFKARLDAANVALDVLRLQSGNFDNEGWKNSVEPTLIEAAEKHLMAFLKHSTAVLS